MYFKFALSLLCYGLVSACANVQPYEREYLADPIMATVDEPMEEPVYEEHMHRARTQGLMGPPTGGGGCGCEQ